MEHEESFHLGISSDNINPCMTTPLPYGTFGGSFNLGTSSRDMNPTMKSAAPYGAIQESFDYGVSNIHPTMEATLPSGGSSAVDMPPILGEYTSMLFQVHQSSAGLSRSAQLPFTGTGGLNDMTDQS